MHDQNERRSDTRARIRRNKAVAWLAGSIVLVLLAAGGTAVIQRGSTGTSPSVGTSVQGIHRTAPASANPRVEGTKTARPSASARASQPRCLNSFDPSCGDFFWDPKPGSNAAMAASLSPSQTTTAAGQKVTLIADALDPDAPVNCHWVLWGDERSALIPSVFERNRYGRWVPPAKKRGSLHIGLAHTYEKPGTYHVQFGARSGDGCTQNYNPYASETVTVVTVYVR